MKMKKLQWINHLAVGRWRRRRWRRRRRMEGEKEMNISCRQNTFLGPDGWNTAVRADRHERGTGWGEVAWSKSPGWNCLRSCWAWAEAQLGSGCSSAPGRLSSQSAASGVSFHATAQENHQCWHWNTVQAHFLCLTQPNFGASLPL